MTENTENRMLSEAYNHTEEYKRDIESHINAIFEKCKELNIPCILAVNHANEPYEDGTGAQMGMHLAVNAVGPERTPPSFVIAAIAIDESPLEAAKAVFLGGLAGGEYAATVISEDGMSVAPSSATVN